MIKNQHYEMIAQFQSRVAIFSVDECTKILEKFNWNCLEAINYVIENMNLRNEKTSNTMRCRIPNSSVNELEIIQQLKKLLQKRFSNISHWPTWLQSTFESAIHQSRGPFAVFLYHNESMFSEKFSRQILCSPTILNVFTRYKCSIWPWDITNPSNQQRLLEKCGRARAIFLECFSKFNDVHHYPLIVMLRYQNNKIILLDIIKGNFDLEQTRAYLERLLNPIDEQSISINNEIVSLSPGWIGGRVAGYTFRRTPFVTTFRLSRTVRNVQRPNYISYYKQKEETPEIIVSIAEAHKWRMKKHKINFTSRLTLSQVGESSQMVSPIPLLSAPDRSQHLFTSISRRRAGWSFVKR